MAVIINDFEIVVEPPQQAHEEDRPAAEPPPAPALAPLDLESILRWQMERDRRLRAH